MAQLETAGRVTETPFPENGNWRDPMRLLVINPNTTLSMTEDIGRTARKYARPGTEVVAISPAHGPRSIEGHFEESVAAATTSAVPRPMSSPVWGPSRCSRALPSP